METLLLPTTVARTADKRFHVSWTKKTVPLKNSSLFAKVKHSEEWHQNIEVTAGVVHPSDSGFPKGFLRNHTDIYLKKKGKLSQAEIDMKLTILAESHNAKDIAIAAAAHAMTAKNLRALLHAELNVARGSYWGLDTWLQCLIAANDGNPASVTDAEALWARKLLPYAIHGEYAAGSYLEGVCRTLREISISNLKGLPEFSILLRRAITDYEAHLEEYRLKSLWVTAHKAVAWMVALAITSPPVTTNGRLLPEHVMDAQFPAWRMWLRWVPDIGRIAKFADTDNSRLALVPDLVALEGPDVVTGRESTLREGLIAQYAAKQSWVRYQGLVIEVPSRTRHCLTTTLHRVTIYMEMALRGPDSLLNLFTNLTTARPITKEVLDLFEAAITVPYALQEDIYGAIREVYAERDELGGVHMLSLQYIMRVLGTPQAEILRKMILQPWLIKGIEKCLQESQAVVRQQMNHSSSWMRLVSELHRFCTSAKESSVILPYLSLETQCLLQSLPTIEQMLSVENIYVVSQAHRRKPTSQSSKQSITNDMAEVENKSTKHPLEISVQAFCMHHLIAPGTIDDTTKRTMSTILHVWESTAGLKVDLDRRSLAILISKHTSEKMDLQHRCLSEIAAGKTLLDPSSFMKDLLVIMKQFDSEPEQAIIALTNLLAARNALAQCWRDLLYMWLEQDSQPSLFSVSKLIEHSLRTMKATQWLCFMDQLERIFTDLPFSNSEERIIPSILQPQLLSWKSKLSRFTNTLTRLEDASDDRSAAQSILICGEGMWKKNVLSILDCLENGEGRTAEPLMQRVVRLLPSKPSKDWEVKECLFDLLNAMPETVDACEKIWDAKHGFLDIPGLPAKAELAKSPVSSKRGFMGKAASLRLSVSSAPSITQFLTTDSTQRQRHDLPPSVVEVMVAGWIQDDSLDALQKIAIVSIASVLDITVYENDVPPEKLSEAVTFWEGIAKEIVEEAERLEGLQKALKAKDPHGTRLLCEEFDIPDNSLLDEEIMSLPREIIDIVERIGENQVEISFPLNAFTEFQRNAMGISLDAKTLLLRLFIDYTERLPPSFCIHYSNDPSIETIEHETWNCWNNSKSAFTWQLNRSVHTQLKGGNIAIADLHRFVKTKIEEIGQSCISCGSSHKTKNARLRRSTPCNLAACAQLWYNLPLDVRLPELKTDIFAVDLALTAVYAAATTRRPELLPGCPISGADNVMAILNVIPSMHMLSHAVNVSHVLKDYHKDAEKLISWACVQHRGYIATATGLSKIPNLAGGTHQFVVVNASPKLEGEFVAKLPRQNAKTCVLFHGTTMDRLPAILSQGLKVCSGTSLQRTGAAHGKGIYMAEEPSTSLIYAASALSWKNSGLSNMRMLLGCEVVGNGRSVSSGIHVVTDEKSVMVRYIFLLTHNGTFPIANHVVPAMASGMSALRSGAV